MNKNDILWGDVYQKKMVYKNAKGDDLHDPYVVIKIKISMKKKRYPKAGQRVQIIYEK